MSFTTIDYLVLTNEDWRDSFVLEDAAGPVDLLGSSFRAHLRADANSLHVTLEASTANGLLEIAGDGVVMWNVPESIMETLEPGTYSYDVVWTTASGDADTIMGGTVTVERGVTR